MIRIPGARLIPINFNPHSNSSACALVVHGEDELRDLSRYTGGSKDSSKYSADFTRLAQVVETAFEGSPYRNKDHITKVEPPEVGVPIRLEPYQKIGIAFALSRRGRAGLFDPMGLGKTVQAIGLALACPENYLPLVVVCPRNAIGAWRNQLGATGELSKAWVRPGALDVQTVTTQAELLTAAHNIGSKPNRDYAYIIWNELLQAPKGKTDEAVILQEEGERDRCLRTIAEALSRTGLLVFDEAHYYRVPTSEAFRRAYMMASTAAHVLALTGTPSLSAVTETLPILALVDAKTNIVPEAGKFGKVITAAFETRNTKKQNVTPWKELQAEFVNRYIPQPAGGEKKDFSRALPERDTIRDFAPYTDESATAVEKDFRQLVVRRSRRSVMEKTPELKIGIGKKDRSLVLVPTGGAVLGTKSDKPYLYWERAGLMALLDGQVLHDVLDSNIKSGMSDSDKIAEVMKSSRVRGILRDFTCATSVIRSGVGTLSAEAMAHIVIPRVVDRFGTDLPVGADGANTYRPTIYFVDNVDIAYDLAGRLWGRYNSIPGFELYLYTGDKKGRVTGSKVKTEGSSPEETTYTVTTTGGSAEGYLESVANRFEPKDLNKPRILVSSQAGREGVDLPAGAEVIFVQRFEAPGLEEQAEDRINRANRLPEAPSPKIRYYMPEHYNSFVLLNRLERRRSSALKTYGETPTSDFSTPLMFKFSQDTSNPRMDYLRRSFAAERDVSEGYRNYLLNRIEWAFNKVRAGRRAAEELMRDRLTTNRVYHGLMDLPPKHKFTDWCKETEKVRKPAQRAAAPAPQPRAPQMGTPTIPQGRRVSTPDIPTADAPSPSRQTIRWVSFSSERAKPGAEIRGTLSNGQDFRGLFIQFLSANGGTIIMSTLDGSRNLSFTVPNLRTGSLQIKVS